MADFKKTTLKNGLRIIMVPQPGSLTTTILVLVATGSKYEKKGINGISHFLEHLCFKGTKNRTTALAITAELDGIGAEYNAFTGEEQTGYHAKAEARHTDKILDIIADLYVNPIFDSAEIEKEKGVIIEEINMYEDLPMRKVQEVFTELLYGDQPAGWPIGGRKEIIKKISRGDIVGYRSRHYVANSTAVIISGGFDVKGLTAKIEKTFKDILVGKKGGKIKTKVSQSKPALAIKYKESDQTHLVLGCRAYDMFDERRFALGVLADILGGGMSSRLFQKIREQMGAAYYVRADADLHTDHGHFAVSAGVDHQKLLPVIKAVLEELKGVAEGSISDKELQRAKDHLSGGLTIGLETSDALAMYYGGQEILKQSILTPKELLAKVNGVGKKEIVSVAKDVFKNSKLNLALIGPYKNSKELEKILRF